MAFDKRLKDSSNRLEDAIVLVERSCRQNRKYQAKEMCYRAKMNPQMLPKDMQGIPLIAMTDSVRELFEALMRRTTADLAPEDLIRYCIQAKGLDKPISTCLMPVSSLTTEKLLTDILKVLQSKKHMELDQDFTVDVLTIRRPVSADKRKKPSTSRSNDSEEIPPQRQ